MKKIKPEIEKRINKLGESINDLEDSLQYAKNDIEVNKIENEILLREKRLRKLMLEEDPFGSYTVFRDTINRDLLLD